MPSFTPPQIDIAPMKQQDPRIGHLLGSDLAEGSDPELIVLGFPSDTGVELNGGRVGAAEGPDAIRRELYKLTPDARNPQPFQRLLSKTRDLGNLVLTGEIEQDQRLLGAAITPYLGKDIVVIILGGGHETSFGHFLGYADRGEQVRIINWDAHPDVRELCEGKPHSGSPFRQILEHPSKNCLSYTVAGLLPHCCATAHLDFLESHGCNALWGSELNERMLDDLYDSCTDAAFVSFDLDALDRSQSPGVSAPATGGMDLPLWFHAAFLAGLTTSVRSIDIVECNPRFDIDGQTAKVAALTVWHFLRGICEAASDA